MNKRNFTKYLNQITNKFDGKISLAKIYNLNDEIKSDMVYFIVRNRGPVLKELIPNGFDMSWLSSMGYLYETQGKEYRFIHTCENRIR